MPFKTKEKAQAYRMRYYRENYKPNRLAFFAEKSCGHCGTVKKLELCHVDHSTKIDSSIWEWGDKKRLAEIAKCIILCSGCHRKLDNTKPLKHGTIHGYQSSVWRCRCKLCLGVVLLKGRLRTAKLPSRDKTTNYIFYLTQSFDQSIRKGGGLSTT